MMKRIFIPVFALLFLASCSDDPAKEAETSKPKEEAKKTEKSFTYKVVSDESKIAWEGRKVGGDHHGLVTGVTGELHAVGNSIEAGDFTMNMETIKVLEEDEKTISKLSPHLLSDDFFHVDSFPTSSFEITDVKAFKKRTETGATHEVSGNLTMLGKTHNIAFPAKIEITKAGIKAVSDEFSIDRTKWDINYKSKSVLGEAADKFIHDNINLKVTLVAK